MTEPPTHKPHDTPCWRLTLRATPAPVDPTRRLRAALKRLLRDHGLRCVKVEPVQHSNNTDA